MLSEVILENFSGGGEGANLTVSGRGAQLGKMYKIIMILGILIVNWSKMSPKWGKGSPPSISRAVNT